MEIFRLPMPFPSLAELVFINRRLRNEEIQLDWSDVTNDVQPAQLEILFTGMTLDEHFTVLGNETIAHTLIPMISAAFEAVADQASYILIKDAGSTPVLPPLWLPEIETKNTVELIAVNDEEKVEVVEDTRMKRTDTTTTTTTTPILVVPSPAAMREELEAMVV